MCGAYGEQLQALMDLENASGIDTGAALSMAEAQAGAGLVNTPSHKNFAGDSMYRPSQQHSGGPAPTMLTSEQLMPDSSASMYQHQMRHFQSGNMQPVPQRDREYGGNISHLVTSRSPRPSGYRGVTYDGLTYEANVMIGGRCSS
jgi:hypothetical protein